MSLKLQASTLAQLTGATNQLTRDAAVNSLISSRFPRSISFEDRCCIEMSPISESSPIDGHAGRVRRCSTSVESSQPMRVERSDGKFGEAQTSSMDNGLFPFKAVNGPLQERGTALNLDYTRANAFPADYDTDLESDWANASESLLVLLTLTLRWLGVRLVELFADGNDFSWATIQKGRNKYYQKQKVRTTACTLREASFDLFCRRMTFRHKWTKFMPRSPRP